MGFGAFDAVIGNPPWVLYAGKGKQPIDPGEEALLKTLYGRAGRTLSTHGLFAVRAGRITRPHGRVGLVVPTSVADASRYVDVRGAHDALCEPEGNLPDFGEGAFVGVFQPCMALISTRRQQTLPEEEPEGSPWRLAQPGLDPAVRRLLTHLDTLSKLPHHLFGERGYRSSREDAGKFQKSTMPTSPYTAPLFEGTSVREGQLLQPTAYADPVRLPEVTRSRKWNAVDVFVRQTARYPIAAPSARQAFRNSILAGLADDDWPAGFLLAYLNSSAARWFHFHKQRDARQGMPQVKIAHLRSLPAPRRSAVVALSALGDKVAGANAGISNGDRKTLDDLVFDGLGIDDADRALIRDWARENPPPIGREGLDTWQGFHGTRETGSITDRGER